MNDLKAYLLSLHVQSRGLWKEACRYDGIPSESILVRFSPGNPYLADMDRVSTKMQQARQYLDTVARSVPVS